MDKFAKKYLLWQAICECGRYSKPFVTTVTINGQIYREECLQKRLLPFLPVSHAVLAGSRFAKPVVMDWYGVKGVNVDPKKANPPNTSSDRKVSDDEEETEEKRKTFNCGRKMGEASPKIS